MVESDKVPFGVRTAQFLMAIAEHSILSNTKHASLLPPSWMTVYELTKLVEELCPGSKIDVFARRKRDGWESYGVEMEMSA